LRDIPADAKPSPETRMSLPLDAVLTRLLANRAPAIERWKELLRIPSIGTDPARKADTRRAAEWLVENLRATGFDAALRETAGQPMVVGHHPGAGNGARPHVLYYGHYDVQPVEPLELWLSPPFEPTMLTTDRGERLVARGAVDDKGQVMTWLEALRAWHDVHGGPPVPVSVFLEGEEESGSPSLVPFLEENRGELEADVCVVSDTGMWDIDTPAISTMLRGLIYVELKLFGPSRDLHSGMYGGAVPNPLNILTRVLGELHDAQGRVQIPGFYDDVREVEEAREWAELPFDESDFLAGAGLTRPFGEAGRSTLERIWSRPTCDINGIWGGYTGPGSKTVIPAEASAKLSCRLVPDQDPQRILASLQRFLDERTPPECRWEVDLHGLSPSIRLPADSPYLQAAKRALEAVFGRPPLMIGMGGSIPAVEAIRRLLGMDSLLVGFGLKDDLVHSPNEKFELRCFEAGMQTHARLLAELAQVA
jgi:acetylornithine deacetylase/succinyl-diaminopimelate desuccinylase-like protein